MHVNVEAHPKSSQMKQLTNLMKIIYVFRKEEKKRKNILILVGIQKYEIFHHNGDF